MKTSLENIDKIFDFEGLWGVPSKCGLKIVERAGKTVVIVSELYLNNPGTSVTQAVGILPNTICQTFGIEPSALVYIEHNPDMNSKLSFYDEEFYLVDFEVVDGVLGAPRYRQLSSEEVKALFK